MKRFARGLADIAAAVWVMTALVCAVGYVLCLGAVEAVAAHATHASGQPEQL